MKHRELYWTNITLSYFKLYAFHSFFFPSSVLGWWCCSHIMFGYSSTPCYHLHKRRWENCCFSHFRTRRHYLSDGQYWCFYCFWYTFGCIFHIWLWISESIFKLPKFLTKLFNQKFITWSESNLIFCSIHKRIRTIPVNSETVSVNLRYFKCMCIYWCVF